MRQHVLILINNSFSMESCRGKVLCGLNYFLENLAQKNTLGFLTMSVAVFDKDLTYLCGGIPPVKLGYWSDNTNSNYKYSHLYDSVCSIISDWVHEKDVQHHLYILSDETDNGSHVWNYEQMITMCESATRDHGWKITFCGSSAEKIRSSAVNVKPLTAECITEMLENLNISK